MVTDRASLFPLEGGCLCAAIRYALTEDPVVLYACHCTDCQTETGASFALSMIVKRDAVRRIRGEPTRISVTLADGREKAVFRCPTCWIAVWGASARVPDLLNLEAGTLDDTSWVRPSAHIWTRSAQPWIAIPPDDLQYPTQADDMTALAVAWKARARAEDAR